MTNRDKIKVILDGILMPASAFFIITLIVTAIYIFVTKNFEPNTVLVQGIANIFVFLVLCPYYEKFKKKYDINISRFSFLGGLYILPLAFSLCIAGNILVAFLPKSEVNAVTKEIQNITTEYNIYISLILVSIVIPLLEELLFRGLFYDTVKKISNCYIAIIFTSVAFAIAHADLKQGIYAFVAGLFLAYIKYKFNRLIYPIVMHLAMNLTSLLFVPQIASTYSFREEMYALFITVSIVIFSIMRIKHIQIDENI